MSPRDVPEIAEALELLASIERRPLDLQAGDDFMEAMAMLDDFLHEPACLDEHRVFISNIKKSYTKNLLSRLEEVDKDDFETWLKYVVICSSSVKSEFDELAPLYPDLRIEFDQFVETHAELVARLLVELDEKKGKG